MSTKNKISLIKAIWIRVITGWRSTQWFSLPKGNVSVLITSDDGTIVDVAQWYWICRADGMKLRWQQGGLSNELIPEHRNAEFWKPLPKSPYRCTT